ncbi:ETC complex I subunit conserved region-domain-containing protein [Mycena pura]|uniref:NADH dehydrogenase [ubiquinone] iron-sulfur protein 4, mitochondrial n=1 Tax=Mycena pura TaxID=153505 RepID=A0AAD6VG90_9AGAR|nr:ETC complex I subunit conserved region-domain-containing protein [Mycena pura]
MLSRPYKQAVCISRRAVGSSLNRRGAATESTPLAQATDASLPVDAAAGPSEVVPAVSPGVFTAETTSGAPSQLRHRVVRVYQPTRNTMQSGGAKGERWRIDFDILQGGGRWENPLMGWASSADYMQGTRVSFKSQEDAIHFAKKQGWDYYVQPPSVKRIPPKNYSENYLYRASKLRIAKTK